MAELPTPIPGLVIRYAYLWQRESEAGQVEGRHIARAPSWYASSWIMATELNSFVWPGPDIVPTKAGEYAYGELPAVVFEDLVRRILQASAPALERSE